MRKLTRFNLQWALCAAMLSITSFSNANNTNANVVDEEINASAYEDVVLGCKAPKRGPTGPTGPTGAPGPAGGGTAAADALAAAQAAQATADAAAAAAAAAQADADAAQADADAAQATADAALAAATAAQGTADAALAAATAAQATADAALAAAGNLDNFMAYDGAVFNLALAFAPIPFGIDGESAGTSITRVDADTFSLAEGSYLVTTNIGTSIIALSVATYQITLDGNTQAPGIITTPLLLGNTSITTIVTVPAGPALPLQVEGAGLGVTVGENRQLTIVKIQ